MLSESVRKTISEQNLLHYISKDSNPSQVRKRIRKQCQDAIRDLTLIAEKSSEETIDDIFEVSLLWDLLQSLLLIDRTGKNIKHRPPNAKLAYIFSHFGILTCLHDYQDKHFDIPEATKLISEHLEKTNSICYEVGRKAINDHILHKIEEANGEYICDFSELFDESNRKFARFIEKEMNIHPEFFKRIQVKEDPHLLESKFMIYDNLEIHGEYAEGMEDELLGEVIVNYNPVKRRGTIFLINTQRNVKKIDFVIEEYLRRKCVVRKNPKYKDDEQNE
jgi:hypothetical protein